MKRTLACMLLVMMVLSGCMPSQTPTLSPGASDTPAITKAPTPGETVALTPVPTDAHITPTPDMPSSTVVPTDVPPEDGDLPGEPVSLARAEIEQLQPLLNAIGYAVVVTGSPLSGVPSEALANMAMYHVLHSSAYPASFQVLDRGGTLYLPAPLGGQTLYEAIFAGGAYEGAASAEAQGRGKVHVEGGRYGFMRASLLSIVSTNVTGVYSREDLAKGELLVEVTVSRTKRSSVVPVGTAHIVLAPSEGWFGYALRSFVFMELEDVIGDAATDDAVTPLQTQDFQMLNLLLSAVADPVLESRTGFIDVPSPYVASRAVRAVVAAGYHLEDEAVSYKNETTRLMGRAAMQAIQREIFGQGALLTLDPLYAWVQRMDEGQFVVLGEDEQAWDNQVNILGWQSVDNGEYLLWFEYYRMADEPVLMGQALAHVARSDSWTGFSVQSVMPVAALHLIGADGTAERIQWLAPPAAEKMDYLFLAQYVSATLGLGAAPVRCVADEAKGVIRFDFDQNTTARLTKAEEEALLQSIAHTALSLSTRYTSVYYSMSWKEYVSPYRRLSASSAYLSS